MAEVKIPEALPKCELVKELDRKADQRKDTAFDFLGTLEAFRKQVAGEVRHIVQVFPEYTPHDEEHHLTRLFHASDRLLEKKRLTAMNSAELMILALGLYGHDWGMAVSERQKECILRGELADESELAKFSVSPKERDWLGDFARRHRVTWDSHEGFKGMEPGLWPEYVRETHAERSGQRVRSFFEDIDRGLGQAGGCVSEAHGLGFEELRQADRYPIDFAVLGETVNLRALEVYLRLVDLLDLSAERTPYVIWKYVAPRDPRPRMEWEKHRAVHSVTFPPHLEGRIVHVEASTDDHEVHAALEDLAQKCDEELRGCSDTLDRMKDPSHRLDLYRVRWRISPIGFEPVSVRFEFDRDQMFEILSDEIYRGDPYVFLRELLQNSIDAIRMRRAVWRRKSLEPRDLGVIRVTVEHGDAGDAVVTWQDDGIGMDDYVVRNYLALAGKSYYRSPDFEREALDVDPISRFGIGILSCFMVADRVEIETYRDPYMPPPAEPLSIKIADMRRQFRIEKRPTEGASEGTTVRVFVSGKKLPMDEHGSVQSLDVTDYVAIVAGFVDFPILIREGDRKTIILHPREDPEEARRRFDEVGADREVRQLDLGYPWSEVILPQDMSIASEVLREEHWDLRDDLQLDGYDGVLTYLVTKDERGDVMAAPGWGDEVTAVFSRRGDDGTLSGDEIRWMSSDREQDVQRAGLSRSCSHAKSHAVYLDGILVASAPAPRSWIGETSSTVAAPPQRFTVNLPKSTVPRLDLSRTSLVGQERPWDVPIFDAHLACLHDSHLRDLLSLEPSERLFQLGRMAAFHRTPLKALWEVFPHDRWPILFLDPGGSLCVVQWGDLESDTIYLAPGLLDQELGKLSNCDLLRREEYAGPLVHWQGERCHAADGLIGARSAALHECQRMLWVAAQGSLFLNDCRFVTPPWGDGPPLLQWVCRSSDVQEEPNLEQVLEKASRDPLELSPVEARALAWELTQTTGLSLARFVYFAPPFAEYFAYGSRALNLNHPAAARLLRVRSALRLSQRRRSLTPIRLGVLDDAVTLAMMSLGRAISSPTVWAEAMRALWTAAKNEGFLAPEDDEDLVPSPGEFVPGTDRLANLKRGRETMEDIPDFGIPLSGGL